MEAHQIQTKPYCYICSKLLLEITGTLREITWFLKDQKQYRLAMMSRKYSELAANPLLPVVVKRNPTGRVKATPWQSIYKVTLLAQDKNPAPGTISLQSMQIKVASFCTALENSMDQIQQTQGPSCIWEVRKVCL